MTAPTKVGAPIRTEWPFFVNSVVAGTIGLVLAHIVEQVGLALAGWGFHRDPTLNHVATTFGSGGSDLAYTGGPVAVLVVGIFLLLIYPGSKDRSIGRLTLLWTLLNCFRIGLTDLALSPVRDTNTAKALATANVPAGLDVVLSAAGIVGLLLVCLAAAPAFLSFCRHRSEVATVGERMRFVALSAVLPGLVSPLLAVPFFIPDPTGHFLQSVPLAGLFTLAILLGAPGTKSVVPPEYPEQRTISWGLVASFALVLAVVHLGLQRGIPVPPWDQHLNWRL